MAERSDGSLLGIEVKAGNVSHSDDASSSPSKEVIAWGQARSRGDRPEQFRLQLQLQAGGR